MNLTPDEHGLVVINGRTEKISDLWRTDPDVVEAAKARFGIQRFNIDACAMPGTAFAPQWLGHQDDGTFVDALNTLWTPDGEGVVWCNPPYSTGNLMAFACQALMSLRADACDRVVFLGKLDPSTRWFKLLSKSPRCHETAMLSPRIAFVDPLTGKPIKSNNFCSVLFDLRRSTPKRKTYSLLEFKR